METVCFNLVHFLKHRTLCTNTKIETVINKITDSNKCERVVRIYNTELNLMYAVCVLKKKLVCY